MKCGDCNHWVHRESMQLRIEGECHAPVPEFMEHFITELGCLTGFYDGKLCKTYAPIPLKPKM